MNSRQTWSDIEKTAQQELQGRLPYNYKVSNSGLSNSTDTDLTVLKDGTVHRRLEVKKLPSVAGVQTVLKEDTNGDYVSSQGMVFTQTMISLANREKGSLNRRVVLAGESEELAFRAFQQKYTSDSVDFILGFTGDDILVSLTKYESMKEIFNTHLIIRPKKSGSARLSKANYELIKGDIEQFSFTGNKGKIQTENLLEIPEIQKTLDKYNRNLYINKTGEIRQLSNTNNLTMLLSLSARENLPESNRKSYDEIAKMLI